LDGARIAHRPSSGSAIGFTPAYLSSEDFAELIARDDAKLARVIADLGLWKVALELIPVSDDRRAAGAR